MEMNDSFEKIAEKLMEAERIYIFPHENPDGDAVGSTAALCSMLSDMGKEAVVLIDEKLPDNLEFMNDDMFVIPDDDIEKPDLAVAIDCNEPSRFPNLRDIFLSADSSVSIDHHLIEKPFCDLNYVDPEAAAAAELIVELMKVMDHVPSKREAEDLFAAITTDTGNFQYSNTTKKTHEIVCELYDRGIDVSAVSTALYENESPEKLELVGAAVERMQFFADGKIAAAVITQDLLKETGAVMSDSEPVVARLRTVAGVEIALVFKERGKNKTSVSMRSKSYANVQRVASALGGGGHVRAAGCTLDTDIQDAMNKVIEAAEAELDSHQVSGTEKE